LIAIKSERSVIFVRIRADPRAVFAIHLARRVRAKVHGFHAPKRWHGS